MRPHTPLLAAAAAATVAGAALLAGCTGGPVTTGTPSATTGAIASAVSALSASPETTAASPTADGREPGPAAPTGANRPSWPSSASPAPSRAVVAARPGVQPAAATASRYGTAEATLAALTVKGRAPMTGYSRAEFGQAWYDEDHNGCDTRNDILRRDLRPFVLKAGTDGCAVAAGTLADPYSGTAIDFTRGQVTSSAVQIDHVVALGDAWQTGAQQWSPATRQAYANDPLVLLAVSGPLNEQKGDADTASWLPPAKGDRCAYVARQIAIKAAYRLWVTPSERAAMARVLGTCPGQDLPTEAGSATPPLGGGPVLPVATTRARTPQPGSATAPAVSGVYYANCTAVRAAGKAPLFRGQPGYRSGLDRDDDGVACE